MATVEAWNVWDCSCGTIHGKIVHWKLACWIHCVTLGRTRLGQDIDLRIESPTDVGIRKGSRCEHSTTTLTASFVATLTLDLHIIAFTGHKLEARFAQLIVPSPRTAGHTGAIPRYESILTLLARTSRHWSATCTSSARSWTTSLRCTWWAKVHQLVLSGWATSWNTWVGMALCSVHYQDVVLSSSFAHTFHVCKGSALASRIEVICRRVIVEVSQQSSDLWTKLGPEWFLFLQGIFQSKDLTQSDRFQCSKGLGDLQERRRKKKQARFLQNNSRSNV